MYDINTCEIIFTIGYRSNRLIWRYFIYEDMTQMNKSSRKRKKTENVAMHGEICNRVHRRCFCLFNTIDFVVNIDQYDGKLDRIG
jgi:hypothetical protein